MITHRVEVVPGALLLARGGSIAAAQSITGDVLRAVAEQTNPGYFEVRASWVAYLVDESADLGLDVVDWDPTTPIPVGAILLRCTGWTAALDPETQR